MGISFDPSWSAGPLGPFPFVLFSETDLVSERVFVLNRAGGLAGSGTFQVKGAFVSVHGTAPVTPPPKFRRTLNPRIGSRGTDYA